MYVCMNVCINLAKTQRSFHLRKAVRLSREIKAIYIKIHTPNLKLILNVSIIIINNIYPKFLYHVYYNYTTKRAIYTHNLLQSVFNRIFNY